MKLRRLAALEYSVVADRLHAEAVGLLLNLQDPDSVAGSSHRITPAEKIRCRFSGGMD
jgi:hypothetical protein